MIRQKFIEAGDSVLAGVSGGVDSMVLTHLMIQFKKDCDFKLSLAHVNYGLRGEESDAQEALVKDFSRKNNLRCFVTKVTGTFSQAAAREFRYHYFAEAALQLSANKVAVAHHLEDQVETILAQWLRGASLRGLGGMRKQRTMDSGPWTTDQQQEVPGPQLIRPLLTFSKEQLKTYAQQEKVPYLEDSSNLSPKYWRNRIRQELLPVIKNLRPGALQKITKLGEELQELSDFLAGEAQQWLQDYARKTEAGYWLPRPRWLQLPRTLRLEVLRQAVLEYAGSVQNLKHDHWVRCEQLSRGDNSEGYYSLPRSLRFIRSKDDLLIS